MALLTVDGMEQKVERHLFIVLLLLNEKKQHTSYLLVGRGVTNQLHGSTYCAVIFLYR